MRPTKLAVAGDSYSSGEGSGDWLPGTGDGDFASGASGTCHRSSHAYAVTVLRADIFVACSGATSAQMQQTYRGQTDQVLALGPDVKTVVLSAGGDDAGFSTVLGHCSYSVPFTQHVSCDAYIHASEAGLTIDGTDFAGFPQIGTNLRDLYRAILLRASHAQLYVVGYPQIFPTDGLDGCNGITPDDQVRLNSAGNDLNNVIRGAVDAVNAETRPGQVSHSGPRTTFVDTANVMTDHWVCGYSSGSTGWINDLQMRPTDNAAFIAGPVGELSAHNCSANDVGIWVSPGGPSNALLALGICSQSFHPDRDGTNAIGAKVLQCINDAGTCDSSPITYLNPALCQVNLGTPDSIGHLPKLGPYQTVITDGAVTAALGREGQPLTPGTQQPNDVSPPGLDQVSRPMADARGSAAECTWTGMQVTPQAPYFFPYDLLVRVWVVPYSSSDVARQVWAAESAAIGPYPSLSGRFALPRIGDDAHYAAPGPEDGNAVVNVLAGRYICSVAVQASGNLFASAPWIDVAGAVATSLLHESTSTGPNHS